MVRPNRKGVEEEEEEKCLRYSDSVIALCFVDIIIKLLAVYDGAPAAAQAEG